MEITLPSISKSFYLAATPVLVLSVGAILAMLQSVIKPLSRYPAVLSLQIFSLLGALFGCFLGLKEPDNFLNGAYVSGSLAFFGQCFILTIAFSVSILFRDTFLRANFFRGEISSLYLMVVTGMLVLVSADDLITLFVGLELSSIGLYVLIGYISPSPKSQEGAIKYFILGAVAAAFLLFGFGLFYAGTGELHLRALVQKLPLVASNPWVQVGGLFTIIGLAFKMSLAPFHIWAPDAYEAAPTGITALMATSVKVMIGIVFLRLFSEGVQAESLPTLWQPMIVFVAMLSMIAGNILAIVQSSIKRMLAYSSIAHSGYMACAIAAMVGSKTSLPYDAILFYLIGYSLVSIGMFSIVMWLETKEIDNLQVSDFLGASKKYPWTCLALVVFMFSFAGMPPTVGFISKFFVFNAALSQGLTAIVIAGVVGSSISVFFYLRIIVNAYFRDANEDSVLLKATPKTSPAVVAICTIAVLFSLGLGMFPDETINRLKNSSKKLSQDFFSTSNSH